MREPCHTGAQTLTRAAQAAGLLLGGGKSESVEARCRAFANRVPALRGLRWPGQPSREPDGARTETVGRSMFKQATASVRQPIACRGKAASACGQCRRSAASGARFRCPARHSCP